MTPDEALRRIVFLLEWRGASPYRVRAFHTAADAVRHLPPGPGDAAQAGRLRRVGPVYAEVMPWPADRLSARAHRMKLATQR